MANQGGAINNGEKYHVGGGEAAAGGGGAGGGTKHYLIRRLEMLRQCLNQGGTAALLT